MRHRRRTLLEDDSSENFWPSFTDLISTIALILFVLVLLAYLQNLISGKSLERVRGELSATLERLRGSQERIAGSEKKLKVLAAQIDAGQAQLQLAQLRLQEQQQVIGDSNRELDALRSRLQGIAVLRLDLLSKVKQSIEAQLGVGPDASAPPVLIAENGNIVIDESLVFEYDSHAIKPDGRPFLRVLATAFAHVLSDPALRESIDVVLVQGHTDERGSASYNRDLSGKRASAVLNYMFEAHPALEHSHGRYFAASAYSEFRPIRTGTTEEDHRLNRRIEIAVVLKDGHARAVIDDYMRGLDPAFGGQPAP